MRKENRIILWPVYFDSTKTRTQGRRILKKIAVPAPKQEEIQKAAQNIGLHTIIRADAKHPKTPWQKTGLAMVNKNTTKTQIIRTVSKELSDIRAQNRK